MAKNTTINGNVIPINTEEFNVLSREKILTNDKTSIILEIPSSLIKDYITIVSPIADAINGYSKSPAIDLAFFAVCSSLQA